MASSGGKLFYAKLLLALLAIGSLQGPSGAVASAPRPLLGAKERIGDVTVKKRPAQPESGGSLQHVFGLLEEALEARDREEVSQQQPRMSLHTQHHQKEVVSPLGRKTSSPVQSLLAKDVLLLQGGSSPGEASHRLLEDKTKDLAKVDAIWQLSEALRELGHRDTELETKLEHGHVFDQKLKGLVKRLEGLASQASEDLKIARAEASALRERVRFLEQAAKGARLESNDPVDAVFQRQHAADIDAAEKLKEEKEALQKFGADQAKKAALNQKEASTAELLSAWLAKEKSANRPLREERDRLLADKAALELQVKELTAANAERATESQASSDGLSVQGEIDDRLRACELDRDVAKRNFEERLKGFEKEQLLREGDR